MNSQSILFKVVGWILGAIIFTLGILNLFLIHPVPGLLYLLASMIFLPPTNFYLEAKFGISIPISLLLIFALIIFWFTLGISDLAEMYGL